MLRRSGYLSFILLVLLAGSAYAAKPGDLYRVKLQPRDGLLRFFSNFKPGQISFTEKPPVPVRGVPKNATRLLFGTIKLGNAANSVVRLMVATVGSEPPKLYVDRNRNRDFADEEPIVLRAEGNAYRVTFAADALYKRGRMIPNQVLFISGEPIGAQPAIYAVDTYRVGKAAMADGKEAALALVDMSQTGDYKNMAKTVLLADPSAGGDFENNPDLAEPYDLRQPFNIGGVTYEAVWVDPTGVELALRVSAKTVAERSLLLTGYPALDFSAKDTNGDKVSLSDFRGKVTLLDFWASWCGPCRTEMPNVKKVYDRFHDQGFEILGISLDQDINRMKEFIQKNGMSWRQVCDGKWWNAEGARLYKIHSIPASFLLGPDGKIIGRNLRAEALGVAVEKALRDNKVEAKASH